MSELLNIEAIDGDGAIRETAHAAGAALTTGFFSTILSPAEAAIVKGRKTKTNDAAILNYALTLEFLEAAFYAQANANIKFANPNLAYFSQVTGAHEQAHVEALQGVLGSAAIASPTFNFGAAVTDEKTFAATAQVLEDTGVAAYAGQGTNIFQSAVLTAALSIHSVEARHAAWIRCLNGGDGPWSLPLPRTNPVPAPKAYDKAMSERQTLRAVTATNFIVG